LKNRSTAIALVISTIMIISAFSMVYAGGNFISNSTNGVTNNNLSSLFSNHNSSIQPHSSQAIKLGADNIATQIKPNSLNSNNNVKYFNYKYLQSSNNNGLYPVYFNQTGLPLGDQWNITINGNVTHTFNISFKTYLKVGMYNYSISKSGDFYPAVASGSFNISSSGAEIQVYFQSSLGIKSTLVMDNQTLIQNIIFSNETNYEPYYGLYNTFNGFYYFANLENGSVSIINGTTGQIYKNVRVGLRPISLTYNPYNGNVYVANSGSSTISVINSHLSISENLTIMVSPSDVLYDPVSGDLFVSNSSEVVAAYNPNGTVTYPHFNSNVSELVLNSNSGGVFVKTSQISIYSETINSKSKQIYYINSKGRYVDSFNISSEFIPSSIAFDPIDNSLYSVISINSTRNLVETNSSGYLLGTWNLPYSPNEIFYDSFSGNLFIMSFNNEDTSINVYSGAMNFMDSMNMNGEIQSIAFSSRSQVFPDSYEDDVYFASPVTPIRDVSIRETGLNSGTEWGFTYSGHEFLTQSETLNFTTLPSNISIKFINVSGYVLNNNLTIPKGSGLFSYLVKYNKVYSVAISESGLPYGTTWNATIGNHTYISTTGEIIVNLTNGTYAVLFSRSGIYYPNPSNTTFIVNGSGLNETLVFSVSKYAVNFYEDGLPSDAVWYLNLSDGLHFASYNHTISTSLPNDTYYYTISSKNKIYRPVSYSGVFTVDGEKINTTINFLTVSYQVNFTETGLPSSVSWCIELNNSGSYEKLTTSYLSLSLENGTYSYKVKSSDSSYSPVEPSGTFNVNGNNLKVNISFKEITFKVTVSESGLPNVTAWFFNLTNGKPLRTTEELVSLNLPNGTYQYSVSVVNKTFEPLYERSNFTVSGSSIIINITFKLVVYNVTFSLNGIPAKTNWSLDLNGINVSTFSLPHTYVDLPNGSYVYTINVWNHVYRSTSGNFSVNGHNEEIDVKISSVRYAVNVNENGLPENSLWYLNLSNGEKLYSSSNIISTELTNGTYYYALGSGNSSFHPYLSSGIIGVSGSNITVMISFVPTLYSVTFQGQNNFHGAWYVNLSNGNSSGPISPGSSYVFDLTNGTYSYVISVSNDSFVPSKVTGIFEVNGNSKNITISFMEVTYNVTFTYNLKNVPWEVVIGNISEFSPSGQPITFNLANGSYSYSALLDKNGKGNNYIPCINGTFTVNGKNVNINLSFKKLNKVFIGTLLPPNTVYWVLSINGTFYAWNSHPSFIRLPDGNYSSSFTINLTIPHPISGPGQQPEPNAASYVNVTVPFYLNVSGPTFLIIFVTPSPNGFNIFIFTGPALPPNPPPNIIPVPGINQLRGVPNIQFPPPLFPPLNNISGPYFLVEYISDTAKGPVNLPI
jgi:hypothetical protein